MDITAKTNNKKAETFIKTLPTTLSIYSTKRNFGFSHSWIFLSCESIETVVVNL